MRFREKIVSEYRKYTYEAEMHEDHFLLIIVDICLAKRSLFCWLLITVEAPYSHTFHSAQLHPNASESHRYEHRLHIVTDVVVFHLQDNKVFG